jgi:hypothetical protein
MDIWYILWTFGIFYGHLEYFFPFWYVASRKIWQPWYTPMAGKIVDACAAFIFASEVLINVLLSK